MPLFKLEHQVIDFHETRHETLATECHPVSLLFNPFQQHQYDSLIDLRAGICLPLITCAFKSL